MTFESRHSAGSTVCIAADGPVGWALFTALVHARVQELASRGTPLLGRRWLLLDQDPLPFTVNLMAVLACGGQVVVPPNFQQGTIQQIAFAFDETAPAGLPAPQAPTTMPLAIALPAIPLCGVIDMYTSGSAGQPKCIRKTLGQFQTEARALEAQWGDIIADAPVIATAPHTHFYGLLFRVFWPLVAGRPFDTALCTDPHAIIERLRVLPRAVLVSSPAQLSRMPELIRLEDMSVRPLIVFSSGGPLAPATAESFRQAWGESPTEVYGSTETGGIAWRRQGPDDAAWTPLPGVQVERDTDTALLVRSGWLDEGGPCRLEDSVGVLDDGRFLLLGRLDRVAKIEEKRLALPDMEARLLEHPWVRVAAVVVLRNADTGRQRMAGVVVLDSGSEMPDATSREGRRALAVGLREHLAHYFDRVLLPRQWRFVQAMPYNERGKLPAPVLEALFVSPVVAHDAAPVVS